MRARGSNARLHGQFEAEYGVPPSANFILFPFVSSNLGSEQGLIESDLLGQGRNGYDPTLDVVTNDGDLVVPVDARAFGHWLTLFYGEPESTPEGAASGHIAFSAQPAAGSTITINGTAFTFRASGASGNEINKGATLADTLDEAATVLNGSAAPGVAAATYARDGNRLTVTHNTPGTAGNAFTLAAQAASNGTVSGATLAGGTNKHVFTSGAEELPSMAIETAHPEVPSFEMNKGVRGNVMRVELSRRGLLNATLALVAKGGAVATESAAGTPIAIDVARFAQATGSVRKDGAQLGSVVAAALAFSNNLDKVETIQPDGEIEDADPGMATATGNVTVRFKDHSLLDSATGRDPIDLSYGWSFGPFSLIFTASRVFLPKPKRPIAGPQGVQASFDWQGSGEDGPVLVAELVNDVESYAI
ncbi:MAG TPA: phage tail tube protein [Sphingomicrobium sp.]|nr:phage tail tube protein [Sphingomicrobium sp.]